MADDPTTTPITTTPSTTTTPSDPTPPNTPPPAADAPEPALASTGPSKAAASPAVPPAQLPADASPLTPDLIKRLKDYLTEARDKHKRNIDNIMFNGATVLVLALTAAAAFIPSLGEDTPKWIAPLCAGLAGVFVAMERALGFGARWRYHREMYYGYYSIIDMLEFYPVFPPAEQAKYAGDIFTALRALRSRESAIPNAGTTSSPT